MLAAEAAGLRDSILPKDNTIAQLTLHMEEKNNTIQSLEARYTTLHEEASERFHEMIEPAVLQEHIDRHKTQVDELTKEVGDLQADVTELTEDNSWYQECYQEVQLQQGLHH